MMSPRSLWGLAGVCGVVFLTYALTRNQSHHNHAMMLAAQVANRWFDLLLIPNHSLYGVLGVMITSLLQELGIPYDILEVIVWVNVIFGTLSAAMVYLILLQTVRHLGVSLFGALMAASSLGFWTFSTDAWVVMPGAFFVLLTFFLGLRLWEQGLRPSTVAASTGTAILGVLGYQNNVFTLPSHGLLLLLSQASARGKRIAAFLGFCLGTGGMLLFIYYLMSTQRGFRNPFGVHSIADFIRYLWAPKVEDLGGYGQWELVKVLKIPRVFIGSIVSAGSTLSQVGQNALDPQVWLSLLVWLFALTVIGGTGLYLLRTFPHYPQLSRWLLLASASWIVLYGGFATWWSVEGYTMWLIPNIALVLTLSVALSRLQLRGQERTRAESLLRGALLLMLPLTFGVNLLENRLPALAPQFPEKPLYIRDHTNPGDLLVTLGADWASVEVPYYARRQVVTYDHLFNQDPLSYRNREAALRALEDLVRQRLQGGDRVYATEVLFDPQHPVWQGLPWGRILSPQDFARFSALPVRTFSDGERLYQIVAAP